MVVDRHPHMTSQGVLAEWRNQREPWKQPLRHAPVIRIRFAVAPPVYGQTERFLLNLKNHIAIGLDIVERLDTLVHGICIDFIAMHVGNMTSSPGLKSGFGFRSA
jgi:hypothetical protein